MANNCEIKTKLVTSKKNGNQYKVYVLAIGGYEIEVKPCWERDISLFKNLVDKATNK